MSYDPRTIAFAAEILHPPQALRADLVQNVHNALYQNPQIGYQNFQVAGDGIHLSNVAQAPGQISSASFLPDRLVLREELRGITVEDFATRTVNVATTALTTLGIGTSLAQQFVVRSLIAPRHFRNGADFLASRLVPPATAGADAFGRPLQALGVRFVFPPTPAADQQQTFQVRVETWPQDPRSIWIENASTYPQPLPLAELPRVADRLAETYQHVTGPVCTFLSNLDTP